MKCYSLNIANKSKTSSVIMPILYNTESKKKKGKGCRLEKQKCNSLLADDKIVYIENLQSLHSKFTELMVTLAKLTVDYSEAFKSLQRENKWNPNKCRHTIHDMVSLTWQSPPTPTAKWISEGHLVKCDNISI